MLVKIFEGFKISGQHGQHFWVFGEMVGARGGFEPRARKARLILKKGGLETSCKKERILS